jgi:hypothetical protein
MAPRPGIYTPAGQRGEHARPGRGIDVSLPYGPSASHVAAAEWGRARPRGATCMRRRRRPALLRASLPVRGACTCTCGCGAQSGADRTRSGVPGVGQPPRPIGARRVAGLARIDRLPGYYCWRLRAGPGLATGRHQAVVTGRWLLFGVRMLPRACMLPVHTACMCMCMPTDRPAGHGLTCMHVDPKHACTGLGSMARSASVIPSR